MRAVKSGLGAMLFALALGTSLVAPAMAQDIDFGDDSSEWANDGECDDPRFTGTGMAAELEDVDIRKDATDCKALFDNGALTLIEDAASDSAAEASEAADAAADAAGAASTAVDFGDDTSEWAKDGECDDPRFVGTGMAEELVDEDTGRDATDCRALFEAGEITLVDAGGTTQPPLAPAAEVDFGDDTSEWAKDGECDDPRFVGTGMAEEALDEDIRRDATDCRALFEAGDITLAEAGDAAAIDFGDDTSEWANDQECDDPRFAGSGMAGELTDDNIGRDATDCRNAFEDGTITLADGDSDPAPRPLSDMAARIDFGDDSGSWPNDGECDDPDFFGTGVAEWTSEENRLADASDCRAAFLAGTASIGSADAAPASVGGFDYGDDSSQWANDGQCDDLRFAGDGMAKKLSADDVARDATDCRSLEDQGSIAIKPVYSPDYAANGPYDSAGVEFGDDSSDYANDGQCDDPRFEGPGVASTVFDSDIEADATDCRAAFEAGTATLI